MKALYEDILALTDKEPDWYDMAGVPRFAKFDPERCPNIYAKEVILLRIQCQNCQRKFNVEMHWDCYKGRQSISEAIGKGDLGYIHYGDPPRHGTGPDGKWLCAAGDTMNSEQIKILEFWTKGEHGIGWERKPEYEIEWEDE